MGAGSGAGKVKPWILCSPTDTYAQPRQRLRLTLTDSSRSTCFRMAHGGIAIRDELSRRGPRVHHDLDKTGGP